VNENGTEAAAATAIIKPIPVMMPPTPIAFTVDHPFIFMILEKHTETIVFMGKIFKVDGEPSRKRKIGGIHNK
jgi:serpin B